MSCNSEMAETTDLKCGSGRDIINDEQHSKKELPVTNGSKTVSSNTGHFVLSGANKSIKDGTLDSPLRREV